MRESTKRDMYNMLANSMRDFNYYRVNYDVHTTNGFKVELINMLLRVFGIYNKNETLEYNVFHDGNDMFVKSTTKDFAVVSKENVHIDSLDDLMDKLGKCNYAEAESHLVKLFS